MLTKSSKKSKGIPAKAAEQRPKRKQKSETPDLTELQATALARQKVINSTPAITDAIIEQALLGHYLHAKMLFDFIGLTAAAAPANGDDLPPIAKFLCEEFGLKIPGMPPSSPSPTPGEEPALTDA